MIYDKVIVDAGMWGKKCGGHSSDILKETITTVSANDATSVAYIYDGNQDSSDDTSGNDFNNTTDPLTVTNAVTSYTHITFATNLLIQIEDEIMRVTGVAGNDVTFAREQGGTTKAAHTSGKSIYVFTAIPIVPGSTPIGTYDLKIGMRSIIGAWHVSCGAGCSIVATGRFT